MSGWNDPPSRTPCAELAAIAAVLGTRRFDLSAEKATQAQIDQVFRVDLLADDVADQTWARALVVKREHRLGPGDIPDFLVLGVEGRWVIEVKGARHRQGPVFRQLVRYADYDEVDGLILATTKALSMPSMIRGKPLITVDLGRAWL